MSQEPHWSDELNGLFDAKDKVEGMARDALALSEFVK
jgi:hypothetical protein